MDVSKCWAVTRGSQRQVAVAGVSHSLLDPLRMRLTRSENVPAALGQRGPEQRHRTLTGESLDTSYCSLHET